MLVTNSGMEIFITERITKDINRGKEWRINEFIRTIYKRYTQRRGRIW